ncbi:MAG: tetratricopeptide repeat protein [Bacteroidota bacterium]
MHQLDFHIKKIARKIVVILLLCVNVSVFSQHITDTMNFAVGLQELHEYKSMYILLGEYRENHPGDVYVEWLYGQAAFYTGRTDEMKSVYKANISAHPENKDLLLDYAFKLTDIGELKCAKSLLIDFVEVDTLNFKIYEYLAKIEYWQGNYTRALRYVDKALELSHNAVNIKELRNEINRSAKPYVLTNVGYFKDNQPLTKVHTKVHTGMFVNSLLTPALHIESMVFDSSENSVHAKKISLHNSFFISQSKTRGAIGVGTFFYPENSGYMIWNAELEQLLMPTVKLNAQLERKPYVWLFKNLDTAVLFNELKCSITREKKDGIQGELAYQSSLFDDNNAITTLYGWFVTPLYVSAKYTIMAGYGYSNTTSKNDIYTHKLDKNELFKEVFLGNDIEGHFHPYITPMKQKVNSLIALVSFTPNKKINISLSASYGFDAEIETPYMYGYFNEELDLVVERGYYTEAFEPFEIRVQSRILITPTIIGNVEYKRSYPNFYYQTDFLEVGIKKVLSYEK